MMAWSPRVSIQWRRAPCGCLAASCQNVACSSMMSRLAAHDRQKMTRRADEPREDTWSWATAAAPMAIRTHGCNMVPRLGRSGGDAIESDHSWVPGAAGPGAAPGATAADGGAGVVPPPDAAGSPAVRAPPDRVGDRGSHALATYATTTATITSGMTSSPSL